MKKASLFLLFGTLSVLFALPDRVGLANPTGPEVVHGQAHFSRPDPAALHITSTPSAIINWKGFSIGSKELTRFIQQSRDSAVLNRVVGADPSQILGRLISNGKVFLVNPHGMVFGDQAVIDTAGFVASTLNITDADFLAGRMHFSGDADSGGIVNNGYITAGKNGNVYLIAPEIENSGIIHTDGGSLLLAAGRSVTITSLDAKGVHFEVQAPNDRAVNLGKLIADNGAAAMFAGTLRHEGEIRADSVRVDAEGNVVLSARGDITLGGESRTTANVPAGGSIVVESGTGDTLVSGEVAARGNDTDGGRIHLLGERVGLLGEATVDASGETGGGEVLVGGDFKGQGRVKTASATYVGPDAQIRADAVDSGDGGRVIVWADDTTRFYGDVSATGGKESGDGGVAEISGKGHLDFRPDTVDLSTENGANGTLLLDPTDIVLGASDSNTTGFNAGTDETEAFGDDSPGTSTFNVGAGGSFAGIANGTTIVLQASNDISVSNSVNMATATGLSAAGTALKLEANNNININAGITLNNGNLTLTADGNNDNSGTVNINADISTGTGSIDATGGTGVVQFGSSATVAAASFNATKVIIDSAAVTATLNVTTTTVTDFGFGAGTLAGTGTFKTSGNTQLGASGDVTLDGLTWQNNYPGKVSWTGGNFTFKNSAVFQNNSADPDPMGTDQGFHRTAAGAGNIIAGTGGGSFTNNGDFHNVTPAGTLTISVPFTSTSGRVVVADNIQLDDSLTFSGGKFEIGSSKQLILNGATHSISGGSIEGGSSGGSVTFQNSATVNITDDLTVESPMVINGSTINVSSGKTLTLNGDVKMENGSPSLNGPGEVKIASSGSTFDFKTGTISGLNRLETRGNTNIGSAGNCVVTGTKWYNYGVARWTANDLTFSGAATIFNNQSGAELELASSGNFDNSITTFSNSGELSVERSLPTTFNASTFTNSSTGTIDLENNSLTISNFTSNSGRIELETTGATLIPNSGSDFTNNSSGRICGNGTISLGAGRTLVNYGTIASGLSPGKLTISGNFRQESSGVLEAELGGTTQATQYDFLNVTGTASLDGSLNISMAGGFVGTVGDIFEIINASAFVGPGNDDFNTVNLPAGYGMNTSATASIFNIEITSLPSSPRPKDPEPVTTPAETRPGTEPTGDTAPPDTTPADTTDGSGSGEPDTGFPGGVTEAEIQRETGGELSAAVLVLENQSAEGEETVSIVIVSDEDTGTEEEEEERKTGRLVCRCRKK